MGSPQLDRTAQEENGGSAGAASGQSDASALRQQAAETLAAHRERRRTSGPVPAAAPAAPPSTRRNPIAAAVAQRYAQTPSYRAILAEQAQRAMEEATRQAEAAAAEAEIAARNAHAIAYAQQELLAELELWTAPQEFTAASATIAAPSAVRQPARPAGPISRDSLTVRLAEPIVASSRDLQAHSSTNAVPLPGLADAEEGLALDEEIAFRQSPAAIRLSDPYTIEPPTPLPANLLEFPRQLVATRKARPRLAEGPLAEQPAHSPQLRIFEVEPELLSTTPAAFAVAPEWASIHLDAQIVAAPTPVEKDSATQPMASLPLPQTAPFRLRSMAVAVDLILVAAGLLAFIAAAARLAGSFPAGLPAVFVALAVYLCLYALYQALFFGFSDRTPGMRYARIAFCTLADENPSRSAIRRRPFALLVALCPLGLGVLWALLDEDGLGWHDRISRMYPRPY